MGSLPRLTALPFCSASQKYVDHGIECKIKHILLFGESPLSLEMKQMSELRNLVVTILDNRRTYAPAGDFPEKCPNCQQPWHVDEAWIDNKQYTTGGRQAQWLHCACLLFEVIDRKKPDEGSASNGQEHE
jgi:hypothetical protein